MKKYMIYIYTFLYPLLSMIVYYLLYQKNVQINATDEEIFNWYRYILYFLPYLLGILYLIWILLVMKHNTKVVRYLILFPTIVYLLLIAYFFFTYNNALWIPAAFFDMIYIVLLYDMNKILLTSMFLVCIYLFYVNKKAFVPIYVETPLQKPQEEKSDTAPQSIPDVPILKQAPRTNSTPPISSNSVSTKETDDAWKPTTFGKEHTS